MRNLPANRGEFALIHPIKFSTGICHDVLRLYTTRGLCQGLRLTFCQAKLCDTF